MARCHKQIITNDKRCSLCQKLKFLSNTANVSMYSQPSQTRSGTKSKPGYALISLFFRYSTLGTTWLNCCHKAECMCIRVVNVQFCSCYPKVAEGNMICQSRQDFKCPIVKFWLDGCGEHQRRWLEMKKYGRDLKVQNYAHQPIIFRFSIGLWTQFSIKQITA